MTNTKPTASFSALLAVVDDAAKIIVADIIEAGTVLRSNAEAARVLVRDTLAKGEIDRGSDLGRALLAEARLSAVAA